jgi:hypothetical protein
MTGKLPESDRLASYWANLVLRNAIQDQKMHEMKLDNTISTLIAAPAMTTSETSYQWHPLAGKPNIVTRPMTNGEFFFQAMGDDAGETMG